MALPLELEEFNKKINTEQKKKKKKLVYSLPAGHLPSEQEFWTEVQNQIYRKFSEIFGHSLSNLSGQVCLKVLFDVVVECLGEGLVTVAVHFPNKDDTVRFPIRSLVAVVTVLEATSAKRYHHVVSEAPHLFPVLRAEQAVLSPTEL